ncbi:hypothetical protein [Paenibacillus sp. NPDC093718]|uniref:hypothetical protein n=1 Tax=Paenibacillus sp. NPDC093718 TaxID=3390601 RepID=UPI003CFE23DD
MNPLAGVGIGTFVLVWFNGSGFIGTFYQGTQFGVATFLIGGFLVRVPLHRTVAVAT